MKDQVWRPWVRAATKPRLLGILVILLIGAVVCVRLGAWQLDRAQIRGDQAAAMEQAERESAPPQPLQQVVGPQTQLIQEMVGVRVLAEGEFRAEQQFFVVGRMLAEEPGFWVLTAMELTTGEHAGTVVPVVRGWVPEADPAYLEDVPQGEVEVLAYLAPSEGAGSRLPEPELVDAVSSAQLVNEWGGPIYSAHLRTISIDPDPGSDLLPPGPPEISDAGLNLQNLAYAAEWWIFGGFAIFLWWRLVRDEVRYDRERSAAARAPAPAGAAPAGSAAGESAPGESAADREPAPTP